MSEPHKGRTEQAKADQAAPDLSNQSTVPPSPIQMKGKILSKAVFPLYGALGKRGWRKRIVCVSLATLGGSTESMFPISY